MNHENENLECIPLIESNLSIDIVEYGRNLCPTEGTLFVLDRNTMTSKCIKCPVDCKICELQNNQSPTSSTGATSANTTVKPTLVCVVSSCKEGYYFDANLGRCNPCDVQCKTCSLKSSNCSACSTTNRDPLNFCKCNKGLSENPDTKECFQASTVNPLTACPANTAFRPTGTNSFECLPCDQNCNIC